MALEGAKLLKIFKCLLKALGEYVDMAPATGVEKLFDAVMGVGVKCIPKDPKAMEILCFILHDETTSAPAKVQKLLNLRFADLDMATRPIYVEGRSHFCAFWNVEGRLYDKVLSLLNLEGKAGKWSNIEGKAVDVIVPSKLEILKAEGN